jgi:NADPH-dependent glutamate synthase beta subunit-like oxidoreductase
LKGGVMPLEVLKDAAGRARGLRLCQCDMNGTTPVPRPGTEFEIEADLIVSAIGQMGLLADGLADLDNGRGFVDADKVYGVKGRPKHFAGGDIVRPHLLTTAIGQGSIAVESIDAFLSSGEIPRRPRIDTHHFRLLDELRQRGLDPEPFTSPTRGTSGAKFAVHNYEDRADQEVISHEELFLGHFANVPRNRRTEIHIKADEVLGNFSERLVAYDETQVVAEAKRCMSCGMCFECDNCVVFCPQTAVFRVGKDERAIGRYVATDYTKCIGCHICKDVCPTGYIQMGLGE